MIYDVAIIGAGPAGSSAAYHLERAGMEIAIIDKSRFPRPKACAGVIPPRIFSELSIPEDMVEKPLEGYRIHSPSGVVVESTFPKPGVIVRREILDDFLLSRLKCELKQMKVLDCRLDDGLVVIEGKEDTVWAKYAIGAFGVSSQLRKFIHSKENEMKMAKSMALGCQFEMSLDQDTIDKRIGNWFEVYYTIPYGYGWISPLKEAIKVGVGGVSEEIKKNGKKVLKEFIEIEPVKNIVDGAKIQNFEAHQIPMGGPYETLASQRLFLCGDAGGFVFPGTGEGIYYAVKSGRIVGEVISRGFEHPNLDPNTLGEIYLQELERNGLLSLSKVDFVDSVLSDTKKAESYVRRLNKLV